MKDGSKWLNQLIEVMGGANKSRETEAANIHNVSSQNGSQTRITKGKKRFKKQEEVEIELYVKTSNAAIISVVPGGRRDEGGREGRRGAHKGEGGGKAFHPLLVPVQPTPTNDTDNDRGRPIHCDWKQYTRR